MNRYVRKICKFMYVCIAQYLPLSNSKYNFFSKKIRYILAKNMIEEMGLNVNIERKAKFSYQLQIGDYSGIGVRCEINGKVIIGHHVLMGPDVITYTINHEFRDRSKFIMEQGYSEERPIYIGNDVWIGRKVMIMPGVKIGDGAVVGAGTVVAKDVPPYTVAVGNPMVFKKQRI